MFGYGAIALILAKYLSALDFTDVQIGLFMSLVLAGDVLLTLITSLLADRVGRRLTLTFWSGVMVASGIVFALFENFYVLVIAAMLGVISTSGNEVGPFRGVEESILAHLVEPDKRTAIYNGYVIIAILGTSVGLPVSGVLTDTLRHKFRWHAMDAYRCVFWLYAALGALNVFLSAFLSKDCELGNEKIVVPVQADESEPLLGNGSTHVDISTASEDHTSPTGEQQPITDRTTTSKSFASISYSSWPIVALIVLLFSIDAFASGMMPYSITNYYIQRKFAPLSDTLLGSAMSGASLLSVPFTVLATPLTRRVGYIRAMVAVHLIAAAFLGFTPLPDSLGMTLVLCYARSLFNVMDQAPRAAFVASIVGPGERTSVNGLVMIFKTFATTWGPSITGLLMGSGRFWLAFVLAGAIKAGYDVGLLICFEILKLHKRGRELAERTDGHQENGSVG